MVCGKSISSASTEELQSLANQGAIANLSTAPDEPQPSTSAEEVIQPWVVLKEERIEEKAPEEEVKTRQSVATKRKSTCDETPAPHSKKNKKTMIKVRCKRS
jgi:hypothetical protein